MRDGVDRMVDLVARDFTTLSKQYREDRLTIVQLNTQVLEVIKSAHVAAALAAVVNDPTRLGMNQARWEYVGYHVYVQYVYARGLMDDLVTGRQVRTSRLDARLRQYANAPRVMYEDIKRRLASQVPMAQERNILHAEEACNDCAEESDRGYVPVGTLTAPGMRACRSACRCTIQFAFVGQD